MLPQIIWNAAWCLCFRFESCLCFRNCFHWQLVLLYHVRCTASVLLSLLIQMLNWSFIALLILHFVYKYTMIMIIIMKMPPRKSFLIRFSVCFTCFLSKTILSYHFSCIQWLTEPASIFSLSLMSHHYTAAIALTRSVTSLLPKLPCKYSVFWSFWVVVVRTIDGK